ncbi:MAG TPA: stage III sporulation protein AF [Candidatus Eisenbergiella stercoravium]|nr:stage III sporulation protein AF [Candidatus Eisenbergiella stercoravium]
MRDCPAAAGRAAHHPAGKGGRLLGSGFLELLKSITIFLLAAQVILRFLPEGGYEKYARIIIGVMVLSRLALPLLSLGGFDAETVFSAALAEYEQEMQRIENQVEQAELKEGGYAQDGLEAALSERLSGLCEEWNVRLVSASLDENGVLSLTVRSRDGGKNGMEDEISIDRIEVGQIRAGEDRGKAESTDGETDSGELDNAGVEMPDSRMETQKEQGDDAAVQAEEGSSLQTAFAKELGMEPEKLEVIWDG